MRLGEALLQEGVINEDQLERALQAHRQFGGRLGTSLIELGYVHPDVVARALSRKHGVPPALRKHFASIDPKVVPLVPATAAQKYGAIPLGFTSSTPPRLVVAFIDPNPVNVDGIAFVVGKRIEPGIAPELQIHFCLEKLYNIKREQKYVSVGVDIEGTKPDAKPQTRERMGSKVILTPPPPPIAASPPATQRSSGPKSHGTHRGFPSPDPRNQSAPPPSMSARAETPKTARADGPRRPAPIVLDAPPMPVVATAPPSSMLQMAAPASSVMEAVAPVSMDPPSSSAITARSVAEGAGLAKTLISEERPSVVEVVRPMMGSAPDLDDAWDDDSEDEDEGDATSDDAAPVIAEESVRTTAMRVEAEVPTLPEERPALSLSGFLDAIESAKSKEDIGDAIVDYLKSSYGAGLVLIHKDDMALGWRGFASDVDATTLESIALPLSTPSAFKVALESKNVYRGAPPPEGASVQSRLFKLLKCASPKEVVVAPIVLGKRIVNFVYAHGFEGGDLPETVGTDIKDVANAAADAYMRLIKSKGAEKT